MVADLGTTKMIYGNAITVQVTDDPCAFVPWNDVDFGTLSYTVGSL